ncbi:MAG: D-2-hydroxyacid dehydrogenase [Syntrophaceae bacterium]|nr:D-2-hydroxyacid dehydrogenase [Syntrophaceae bacterium]
MPHRLLIYHPEAKIYEQILLKRLPDVEIHSAVRTEEAIDFIEEIDILLSWHIPDDLLRRAKRLVWFSSMAAGNEDLIRKPSLSESVILTKATVYGEMMAEYVFSYILYFARSLSKYFEDQRNRVCEPIRPVRLRGKTMGIVGLGSAGKEIAKQGKQFGMDVLGVRRIPGSVEHVDQVFGPNDLEKMIPLLNYLVVVLPLTPETYHLLGEKELSLLREGSLLFNIGRGRTIDEAALIRVLKTKRIKAVLDVFENEPLPRESELWGMENVIITPHVSGINIPEEICEEFVRNYGRWVRGEPLIGLVDREKGY